jgi:hypothetical protein
MEDEMGLVAYINDLASLFKKNLRLFWKEGGTNLLLDCCVVLVDVNTIGLAVALLFPGHCLGHFPVGDTAHMVEHMDFGCTSTNSY